jgi:hypothetical protein
VRAGHLPADAALADVLYRSPIQQETPLCRAQAESWRRYLQRYAVEHPDPELVPVITPLVDHRLPA